MLPDKPVTVNQVMYHGVVPSEGQLECLASVTPHPPRVSGGDRKMTPEPTLEAGAILSSTSLVHMVT